MIEHKPNTFNKYNIKSLSNFTPKIFLGGSIEMGTADDWQSKMANDLSEFDCVVFNPRREDWDSSWEQTPVPGEQFYEQVDWELKAQEASNFIVYNFLPETKSPITLLELGLFAKSDATVFVVCPKTFWRYGNVKIVSDLQKLNFFHDTEEMVNTLKVYLSEWDYITADSPRVLRMNPPETE